MKNWRRILNEHKSISRLLVVAFLFVTFQPSQFYFHHQEGEHDNTAYHNHEVVAGGHVVDMHLVFENSHVSDHYKDVHIIPAKPEVLVNKIKPEPHPFFLMVIVLCLLPVLRGIGRVIPAFRIRAPESDHYYSSPPLRAPPAY